MRLLCRGHAEPVSEARTAPYLDLEARQVAQPNVPRDRAGAERSMQEYLNRKMSQPP